MGNTGPLFFSSSGKPGVGDPGLVTVFNPSDGTFSLSLETARSLGLEVSPGPGATLVQQVELGSIL
jgi:hypothetical protein